MNQQTLRTYKEVKAYSVRSFEKEVAICRRLNCCLDPSRHRIDVNGPEIVPVTESTITYNNGLYTELIKVQQQLVWKTVLKRAIWLVSYVKSVCYWRCRCPPTFFLYKPPLRFCYESWTGYSIGTVSTTVLFILLWTSSVCPYNSQ